jgi:isoleucyl-tRNA synthetase
MKVRQPLSKVEIVLADDRHRAWLKEYDAAVREELNVKQIEYLTSGDQYITYTVLPDLKRLGPRLGKRLSAIKQALAAADGGALLARLKTDGKISLALPDGDVELDSDDIQVRMRAKPGWSAAQGARCVVVLSTELTPELVREGLAREIVRAIQDRRKEIACQYTDRIAVGVVTESAELKTALAEHHDYIAGETLATRLGAEPLSGVEPTEAEIGDVKVALYVQVIPDRKL